MGFLDLLKTIFQSDTGSFGAVVVILGAVLYAIIKVSTGVTKMNLKTENLDSYEKKVEDKFDRIETKFGLIKDDLSAIKAFIEIFKDRNNPLAQRQSPVALTEKGKEFAKALNIPFLITNHLAYIEEKLNKVLDGNSNPYDVQVASFNIGDNFVNWLTLEELNEVKKHAFNSGFDLDVYGMLFSIEIRDKRLRDLGLTPKDVDKFDPKAKNAL